MFNSFIPDICPKGCGNTSDPIEGDGFTFYEATYICNYCGYRFTEEEYKKYVEEKRQEIVNKLLLESEEAEAKE